MSAFAGRMNSKVGSSQSPLFASGSLASAVVCEEGSVPVDTSPVSMGQRATRVESLLDSQQPVTGRRQPHYAQTTQANGDALLNHLDDKFQSWSIARTWEFAEIDGHRTCEV